MTRLTQYDTYQLPVTDIFYDESFNCRNAFTPQSVHALAESIKAIGLQFPVVVQPYDTSGFKYRLLAGHRRFKAITVFLKWETIPATIRNDLTGHEAQALNLIENLERANLNILEEAQALGKLYPDGIVLRTVARELNRPTRWVHTRRRLLDLPEEVQQAAAIGLISAVNIEVIHKLKNAKEQVKAGQAIIESKTRYGKTRALRVRGKYKRKFCPRKTKQQTADMIIHLYNVNCEGLATRVLAWVAGKLTDQEIEKDIRNEPTYKSPGRNYRLPYRKH